MALDPFSNLYDFLVTPLYTAHWADWWGFWLRQVFDDRFTVVLFFPFLPLLLLCSKRWLRGGIVATGLGFLALAFGVPYALFWAVNCAFFYWFAERYADALHVDARLMRRASGATQAGAGPGDAEVSAGRRRGLHLLAICTIVGWYLLTMALDHIPLSEDWNRWLFLHARWCFPFQIGPKPSEIGADGVPALVTSPEGGLLRLVLWNPHNIGTAYLVWRMTHYLSDVEHGLIPRAQRTMLNFFAYVCYAPNLIQGPIERFERFQEQMDNCHAQRRLSDVPIALARIAWGVTKSLISTLYFIPLIRDSLGYGPGGSNRYFTAPQTVENYGLLYFGVFFIIYGLYLEFSGYCDISAGIGRLLGYRQVENFDWCWFSTSLRDFWRRWHISLSSLLRDYVYIALGGNRRHATWNLIVTFAVCGVWHIPNGYMAAWGVLMGIMLTINQAWVNWMKRLDAQPVGVAAALRRGVKRLHPLGPVVSWLFTMHCFVFSLIVFFGGRGGWRVAWEIVRRPLAALTGAEVFGPPGH